MKKLSILSSFAFILFFSSIRSDAQTSTINGLIQDPNGQAFVNGTCTIQFSPPSGQSGPFLVNGASFNQTPACTFDGSGNISATVSRTDFIKPGGGLWNFTVCPAVDSGCTSSLVSVVSPTLNVASTLNPSISIITVSSRFGIARAYSDGEIVPIPNPGAEYYNVITNTLRIFNGTSWSNSGSGSITINTIACGVGGSCTIPIGATANSTIGTIPYLSAANTFNDSPLTRVNSTTVQSTIYKLPNGSLVQENGGGSLSLQSGGGSIFLGSVSGGTALRYIQSPSSLLLPGLIISYNNTTTAGMGIAPIYGVFGSPDTNQTTSLSNTTIFTTSNNGLYRLSVAVISNGTCATPGLAGVTVGANWQDVAGAKSISSIPLDVNGSTTLTSSVPLGNTTGWGTGQLVIKVSSGQNIQINTTLTGCTVGTATYQIDACVEQLR